MKKKSSINLNVFAPLPTVDFDPMNPDREVMIDQAKKILECFRETLDILDCAFSLNSSWNIGEISSVMHYMNQDQMYVHKMLKYEVPFKNVDRVIATFNKMTAMHGKILALKYREKLLPSSIAAVLSIGKSSYYRCLTAAYIQFAILFE